MAHDTETEDGVLDPVADAPEIQALLNKSGVVDGTVHTDAQEVIEIEDAPDGFVELVGGVAQTASVKELTGRDEETLSKDSSTTNWARYMNTMLLCGVELIDGEKVSKKALDQLLIGDRDLLLMHIRRVTYGDDIEMHVVCPNPDCRNEMDILYTLSKDVPIRQLDGDLVQRVELTKGRWADVRLPNGADQEAVFSQKGKTTAEQNTIMLSRIVVTFMDGPPPDARDLAAGDRMKIITWIDEKMPGPRYDEVNHKCEECEGEFPVILNAQELFRG